MSKNNIYKWSKAVEVPLPAGLKPGQPAKVGELVGVALNGTLGKTEETVETFCLDGSWVFQVAGAVTVIGSKVYIASNGDVTTTATSNTFLGYALAAKSAPAGPLPVYVPGV